MARAPIKEGMRRTKFTPAFVTPRLGMFLTISSVLAVWAMLALPNLVQTHDSTGTPPCPQLRQPAYRGEISHSYSYVANTCIIER